jgi:hypothetical protein
MRTRKDTWLSIYTEQASSSSKESARRGFSMSIPWARHPGKRGRRTRSSSLWVGEGAYCRYPGAELALTYSDIWSLEQLPASVAVAGGAATGFEAVD